MRRMDEMEAYIAPFGQMGLVIYGHSAFGMEHLRFYAHRLPYRALLSSYHSEYGVFFYHSDFQMEGRGRRREKIRFLVCDFAGGLSFGIRIYFISAKQVTP